MAMIRRMYAAELPPSLPNRRRALGAAAVLATLGGCASPGAVDTNAKAMPIVKPPRLQPGATVGLIAPGGVVDATIVAKCVANLESLGFKVKRGANLMARWGGYAGIIEQRVDDLHAMFQDESIGAIWTARGGSGCAGLLPHIDYAMLRRSPKILVGYSDITALHLALQAQAGLVSFHAPVAWSTFSAYSVAGLRAVLMQPGVPAPFGLAPDHALRADTEAAFKTATLSAGASGVAQGRLTGGNLSVVAALVGTPYAAQLDAALVFLEEVGEEPYRIDRMLHQLGQSAALESTLGGLAPAVSPTLRTLRSPQTLQRSAAVIMGVFSKCEPVGSAPALSLQQVLAHHFALAPMPVVYGYSLGHIAQQMTLPVGVNARLDVAAQTVTLLESAVV